MIYAAAVPNSRRGGETVDTQQFYQPQAVGDLQGECCCLGYVRLTQCIDTGFDCGTCPTSGTESGCDEDEDGSEDYANVIYIDQGIWEQKAKTFSLTTAPEEAIGLQ